MLRPRLSDLRWAASPVSIRKPYIISLLASEASETLFSKREKKRREKGKYRLKSSGLARPRRGIVDGDARIIARVEFVRNLGHSFVAAVASAEIQVRRPVVGEILFEMARRAAGEFGDIT